MTIVERLQKAYSKTQAKKVRAACKRLLAWYEGHGTFTKNCELCEISDGCADCPWKVIQRTECVPCFKKFSDHSYYGVSTARTTRDSRWSKFRARQLRRWIGYINKAFNL